MLPKCVFKKLIRFTMPPKNRKLSPEQLEKMFNTWLTSEEYLLKESIIQEFDQFEELNEITPDFVNKYQKGLSLIAQIPSVFRIRKTGIKSLSQEQIRTAFFGGVNKRDEPFKIDDSHLDFKNKDVPKNCRHVKLGFVNLLKVLKYEDLESFNFLDWRKNKLIYSFKEFSKFFKEHSKKGHLETKTLMMEALHPFIELMRSNMKLVVFELGVSNHDQLMRNFFKYKANIISFCRNYQPCQEILFR